MEKSRIPLNVEPELREMFTERLEAFNADMSLTAALRSAMYHMVFMNNDELRRFIDYGRLCAGIQPTYRKAFTKAQEEGIVPEGLQLANPEVNNVNTVLTQYNTAEINKEQAKERLEKIQHRIEWSLPALLADKERLEKLLQSDE